MVVGGVLFSTFLTLLLVPVVYSLLARFTKAKRVVEDAEEELEPVTASTSPAPAGAPPSS